MRWFGGIASVVLGACGGAATAPGMAPSCSDPARGPTVDWFEDATHSSGIEFTYANVDFRGGGLAVADLDGDGLPEVVAGNRSGGVAVFHNLGGLRFAPVETSGIDPTLPVNAIAAVDLDNDGDRDLVIAGTGTTVILANQGDGTFREAARFANTGTTEHVLAADFDGDGLLDLYLSNRDQDSPSSPSALYLNLGALRFSDPIVVGAGLSWTATAFDINGDGQQDLYVANDTLLPDFGTPGAMSTLPPDLLLYNDGAVTRSARAATLASAIRPTMLHFTDLAAAMGIAQPRSSMGGVLGDFDGDGQLDLYVPNLGAKKLFIRDGESFVDQAAIYGVQATFRHNSECSDASTDEDCLFNSWSAAFTDFDLDGSDDLIVISGPATTPNTPPPVLTFTRGSQPTFHEVTSLPCVDARGLVATDLDADGDQDLVIAQQDGPLLVYANRATPPPGAWLRVLLHGRSSNREGVGAIVTVQMTSGRTQIRPVAPGGVLNSSSPAEAFFGLGSGTVETLDIQWPSGRHSQLAHPPTGVVTVTEPAS